MKAIKQFFALHADVIILWSMNFSKSLGFEYMKKAVFLDKNIKVTKGNIGNMTIVSISARKTKDHTDLTFLRESVYYVLLAPRKM